MKKHNVWLVLLLKAAVGIGLLAFFFFRLDLDRFFQAFTSAHVSYALLALFAYFAGKTLTAVRWALLARPLGFPHPLKDFIAFYYIGMFFNLVGPSTLGGDAGKVFYLSRDKFPGSERSRAEAAAAAVVSILADRLVGMAGLVYFLSKLGVAPEKAVANGVLWLAIVVAAGLAGGLAFVLRRRSATQPVE